MLLQITPSTLDILKMLATSLRGIAVFIIAEFGPPLLSIIVVSGILWLLLRFVIANMPR